MRSAIGEFDSRFDPMFRGDPNENTCLVELLLERSAELDLHGSPGNKAHQQSMFGVMNKAVRSVPPSVGAFRCHYIKRPVLGHSGRHRPIRPTSSIPRNIPRSGLRGYDVTHAIDRTPPTDAVGHVKMPGW